MDSTDLLEAAPLEACAKFIEHLSRSVEREATGAAFRTLAERPESVFWLGRLAPEESVALNRLGERGERLDPCAAGMTLRLQGAGPWTASLTVRVSLWCRPTSEDEWEKIDAEPAVLPIQFSSGSSAHGRSSLAAAFKAALPNSEHQASLTVDVFDLDDGTSECTITLVNETPLTILPDLDPNLYETQLEVTGLPVVPFLLDALPDSFRYDRRIPAYGVNCGVEATGDGFRTVDLLSTDVGRPTYWDARWEEPDLRFMSLALDAGKSCEQLLHTVREWHDTNWGEAALDSLARKDRWSADMRGEANAAAADARAELSRIETGVELLKVDTTLGDSFAMMNEAMTLATAEKPFDSWRPFQLGFLLANLSSISDPAGEAAIADIIWFATGGGKTETYLGLLLTAAFHDRLTGKHSGTTAWSRFPLRMLSLQQTQRFADALAAAELVRQRHEIDGDPFSLGFLVGGSATPNRIPLEAHNPGDADPDDETMPDRFKILSRCPFCGADTAMRFDRVRWTLDHVCPNDDCPWGPEALPFRIVDDEIYRFLPTVVVGTVDKVANVSMQASMRGLVATPQGRCDRPGHGYTYASRAKRRGGCLVPGCQGRTSTLEPEERRRMAPSFRLQDELHLMRDSLGAVDSHYEGLLDALAADIVGHRPKILASSATLAGHERQVAAVYQRVSRVFPQPPPTSGQGFWSQESNELARRFIAVAPRGVTLEYALDRLLTVLQREVRKLVANPDSTIEFGVDPSQAPMLVDLYGTDVVYGNTLRDLDAVVRSTETQLRVDGDVHTATLTGSTDFEAVRDVLERLEQPEADFEERVHIVAASSMMSHGVDIDRLNVMAVYGLPLATAEFIQATAHVGRRHPAIVFVLHKIARERDASVFRNFGPFVRQGDRFVDSVPVTRHSRRVLARTLPGIELARLRQVLEPRAGRSLATARALCEYFAEGGFDSDLEIEAVIRALGFDRDIDAGLRADIARWFEILVRNMEHPPPGATFPDDLLPGRRGPMRSLRDVEEQVPVIGLVR